MPDHSAVVPGTWERGTTNMIEDDAKGVSDLERSGANPADSRKAWGVTRKASRA